MSDFTNKIRGLVSESASYEAAASSGDTKWAWAFSREASSILPELQAVVEATIFLRMAQKAYMLRRGDEALGQVVASAAKQVDDALLALQAKVGEL